MQALFIRFSCPMRVFNCWCQSSFETGKLFVQLAGANRYLKLSVPLWKHSFTHESLHKLLI